MRSNLSRYCSNKSISCAGVGEPSLASLLRSLGWLLGVEGGPSLEISSIVSGDESEEKVSRESRLLFLRTKSRRSFEVSSMQ